MSTAFQQTITNQQSVNPGFNGMPNANSLINPNGPKAIGKGTLSFAQEFARVKELTGNERGGFNPDLSNADLEQVLPNQNSKKHISPLVAAMIQNVNGSAEGELKSLRDKELNKEIKKVQHEEEVLKDTEELATKYQSSETIKAAVSQENQKTITEAIREGNVAEQEKRHYEGDGNNRKRQLANWEDLAPKITEDSMNRAVRIDIPGLNDIETIIVRMNRDAVSIQAIGSKGAMERLHSNQTELIKNLQDKNVKLASLQVFDGDMVRNFASKKGAGK